MKHIKSYAKKGLQARRQLSFQLHSSRITLFGLVPTGLFLIFFKDILIIIGKESISSNCKPPIL